MKEIDLKCKYYFNCDCSELSHDEIMQDDRYSDEVHDTLYHDVIPEIQAKLQEQLGIEIEVADIDINYSYTDDSYFIVFFTAFDDMGLYSTAGGISKVVDTNKMTIEKRISITMQSETRVPSNGIDPPEWDEWDCNVDITCSYDTEYGIQKDNTYTN